jgi:L-amino acid N-acyltransferase YncA
VEVQSLSWREIETRALSVLARVLSCAGDAFVWLIYQKDLREPVVSVEAKVPIRIDEARLADADEMARLWGDDSPTERDAEAEADVFRSRLRDGSICLVARLQGRIVAYDWIRRWKATGPARVPVLFAEDEAYTTDAYTGNSWRGYRIHPALNHALLQRAQREGFRVAFSMVRADNPQSLLTLRRMGWVQTGALLCFEPDWGASQPIWFTRGSAYPMPIGRLAANRVPSLADLMAQRRWGAPEVMRSLPWSTAWRLQRDQEVFELVSVPLEHASQVRVAAWVARAFPDSVPAVEACNYATEAWLLSRSLDGAALPDDAPPAQLIGLLTTYAQLQLRSLHAGGFRHLPEAPLDGLMDRLLSFLAHDDEAEAHHDGSAGAAYFLGQAEAYRLHQALQVCGAALARYIELAKSLPRTLNHGDLLPMHAAQMADGSYRLRDWIWASSGPAGLSLHALVGESLPVAVLRPGAWSSQGGLGPYALAEHYLQTMVQGGYAPETVLRERLPAAITAGLVLDILRMATYPMDDPDQCERVAHRLRHKLRLLLDVGYSLCAVPGIPPGA